MKILFLTPWYPDDQQSFHGIFIQDQARALARANEVIVISSKIDYSRFSLAGYSITEKTDNNVKEVQLIIRQSLPLYNQINYFFISTWVAIKIGKQFKPDIIHGNIGFPGGYWSYLVSRFLKTPYVITEHTKIENNFRSFFHKKLTMIGYRKASRIITVSHWMASLFYERSFDKVDIIPNIVKVDQFIVSKPILNQPIIQMGFLGSLFSEKHTKGLDLLLSALQKIKINVHLHIGGGGKMLDWYKHFAIELGIQHCCTFYGSLKPDEISNFMNRLNLFVCASRVESFGIALLEAMASGIPVLSTNCGGPADFIQEENGILVEKENVLQLKEGIEKISAKLNDYDPVKIRNFAVQNFSYQAFLERINNVYNSLNK